MNKLTFIAIFVLSIAFMSNTLINSKSYIKQIHSEYLSSTNPPVFHTGAPGENDCTACHTGSVLNPNNVVNFSFSGGANYELNQTYTIELSVDSTNIKNGFELTILDIYGLKVGSFINGNNSLVTLASNKEYVGHSTSLNQYTFTFQWTSPSVDRGNIFVYYCFNISNNSNTVDGDKIYKSQEIIYGPTNSMSEIDATSFSIFYNPDLNLLSIINNPDVSINFYNINGKDLTKDIILIQESEHTNTYQIPDRLKNQFIIVSIKGKYNFAKKVFIY